MSSLLLVLGGSKHVLGNDPLVVLLFSDVAGLKSGGLKGGALLVRSLGDVGSLVVADVGVEGGDQHEGLVDNLVDLFSVGNDAFHAVQVEGLAGVTKQSDGVQHILDDQGLEHVQLEVTVAATDSHGDVVAYYLGAAHSDGLALGGVDLAGHDGRTRLVLGKGELTETATGAGAEEPNVVGDLHKSAGEGVQGPGEVHKRVLGSESLELVVSSSKGVAGILGQVLGNSLSETDVGVETSADSSASLGDLVHIIKRLNNTLLALLQLVDVGAKLLTEGQGSSILSVGTANLDNVRELVALQGEGLSETDQLGQEALISLQNGRDVHDRGEGVVGGLTSVNIVIGVDGLVANYAAQDFSATVADDLVGVHVGLGAGTSLPDHKGEVIIKLAGDDLVSSLDNGVGLLGVQTVVKVRLGGGLLKDTERLDDGQGHSLALSANLEVLEGALGLRAPVFVSGHLDGAKGVTFLSKLGRE